jgi:translation elongation factor EF-Ts
VLPYLLHNNITNHFQDALKDDTNLTYASNNIYKINHNINENLAKVGEWLTANRFTLNQTKAEFILIGSHEGF